jgi:hypothetical protein
VNGVRRILEDHFASNTAPGSCNCEVNRFIIILFYI